MAEKTNKSPAFQWYPKDILTSMRVAQMSLQEEGAYRRALDFCWLNGSLPSDLKKLSLVIGKGCNVKIAAVVKEMFIEEGEILTHERLNQELKKQQENKQKRSEAGKKGNELRWNSDKKSEANLSQCDDFAIAENRLSSSSSTSISNNTNVINLNASCEFRFSVGKNVYQGLPSDLAKTNEHVIYLNNWLSGKITIEEFSKVFDEDFKSKMFSNERHFQNSISSTVKKIISNKHETFKPSFRGNNGRTEAIESGKIKNFSTSGF